MTQHINTDSKPHNPAKSIKVSVIVPTRNSSRTLGACLSSVAAQSYSDIEIIVVDNNSTDDTKLIAYRYTDDVYNLGPERSAQRNFGVSKSRGDYVILIDSDMELSSMIIDECVEKLSNDETILGLVIPEESFGESFWAQCKKLERSFYVGVTWMEAARAFRRNTYVSVGGYDVTMISGEDWDLSQRVANMGGIGRIESYIYHNEGNLRLLSTLRKKFYYAQKFSAYKVRNNSQRNIQSQTSPLIRYKLFLSQPRKLFAKPIVGFGMLYMKTCEFFIGALGVLTSKR